MSEDTGTKHANIAFIQDGKAVTLNPGVAVLNQVLPGLNQELPSAASDDLTIHCTENGFSYNCSTPPAPCCKIPPLPTQEQKPPEPGVILKSSAQCELERHFIGSHGSSRSYTCPPKELSSENPANDSEQNLGHPRDPTNRPKVYPGIGSPGPFQIIESGCQRSETTNANPPRRRYSCSNYETCLNLAAALNWDNFTCRGCSGEINQTLQWQGRQAQRRDLLAKAICNIKLKNGAI
jgi:hypothetical protein